MEPLLYLVHRMPYPPNKGDKIRSFHLLRFLSRHYRVYLGTFVDRKEDARHAAGLTEYCADLKVVTLSPLWARARCALGLLRGDPLTLAYYSSHALQRWVNATIARHAIRKAVCFSSAMTAFLDRPDAPRLVADFCDVDSQKWAMYAERRRWPASAVFKREARTLLAFERRMAARASACTFVTPAEVELFARLAPECASKLHAVGIGVDAAFFAPHLELASPFGGCRFPIVFTGVMDYWPNVDAVTWFTNEVMPQILASQPLARFYIVGMKPTATVKALACAHVVVTGPVPDTRPYLQHARVAVAPLRVARGVQSKVIEAMAMGRPVVVSAIVAHGISGKPMIEFDVAHDANEFARKVLGLMNSAAGEEMGRLARQRVVSDYNWDAHLTTFATLLAAGPPALSLAPA